MNANRAALDSAYARAMAEASRRWPEDATIATLHADALMNLSPWHYFEAAGKPRPGTRTILALLEDSLRREPDHPGACHLYIHAVEQYHPQKAVACAERLAALMPGAGHIVHMPGHIYIRVGRYNDAMLAEPMPPANLPLATGLDRYARGVAFAALGDIAAARKALAEVERAARAGVEPPFGPALDIAREMLAGEIAARQGDTAEAIRRLRAAVAVEDRLAYMEPPYWHVPVRHQLGALLLDAGRPAEAERVYREDLERFPENGWSLFGLMESLEAQGKEREAAQARRRFEAAWAMADVVLKASRS